MKGIPAALAPRFFETTFLMTSQTTGRTVAELAALVGGRVFGGGNVVVERVAGAEKAEIGDLVFVEDPKFLEEARASRASCVILAPGMSREGMPCVIEAARPKLAFALIAETLHPSKQRPAYVHPTANVAEGAKVGAGAHVGEGAIICREARIGEGTQVLSGVVIGERATVGRDCVLHPNVVLYEGVSVGDRVVLHAGVCVGADGFGYVRDEGGIYHKFPQLGTVIIEDDVEIGANSCVDRGALGETHIGRGTKIDNLVQVGHNVRIGERVVIAAQTGISGSTVIEDDAVIGGQVGMGDHARVCRGAVVGSKAGILPGKVVRPGAVVWGVPVRPLDEYKRLNAYFGRLPQMRQELDELKSQLRELMEKLAAD